jgi:hypothetical protein
MRCRRGGHTAGRATGAHALTGRNGTQYSTADSWLEDQGLPVDPRKPADRKVFRKVTQDLLRTAKKASLEKVRRGPKPKILDRIVESMNSDILNGRLPPVEGFDALSMKDMEFRCKAKRERIRTALKIVTRARTHSRS